MNGNDDERVLGAYIHIPFCNYKCHFCDFITAPNKDDVQDQYCQVLRQEIEQRMAAVPEKPLVKTIFYGGGTPGTLDLELLALIHETLLSTIRLAADAEINLETTPDTVDLHKAMAWRALGINRLSIGIESFDDGVLTALGRKHTVTEAVYAIETAIQAGFENINCDLMYALPGQDCNIWQKSLGKFLEVAEQFTQIKHLSAYALELAPQTPLAKMLAGTQFDSNGKAEEDEFVAQHNYLLQTLPAAGFEQYEISNFSKSGFQSTHNLNYWRQGDYLAFGVSAHRYLHPYRSSNWRSLSQYMSDYMGEETRELIDESTRFKETIMLGLRMNEGIDLSSIEKIFGCNLLSTYPDVVTRLKDRGLITHLNGRLKLTTLGQPVANSVIADFF